MRKKVFWVCLLIWALVCCGLIYAGYHDNGRAGAIFGAIFAGLLAVPVFAMGFGGELGKDLFGTIFAQNYDELEKEYGPILKKTSVFVSFIGPIRIRLMTRSGLLVEMSICEKALFLSRGKKSFCVPYLRYTIEHFRNGLIIKDAIPETLAARLDPGLFATRRDLTISNFYSKDLDFVMSLVEQARQKQQNSQN